MKRCPKCSRSYPDDNQKFCTFDGGLLIAANQSFDPNATIQSSSPLKDFPREEPAPRRNVNPDATRDLGATIASIPTPTANVRKPAGPTGSETIYERAAVATPAPPKATMPSAPRADAGVAAKKSKAPLIIGVLLLLLVLGAGAVIALYFFVIKPQLNESPTNRPVVTKTNSNNNTKANNNSNTSNDEKATAEEEVVVPPNAVHFANSRANLDGKLADHFFDFSFNYPKTWEADPKAGVPGASNFVKVERRLPPDFTQENFAVGWYTSRGTYAEDKATFPQIAEILSANLAKSFPEYRKISEGPTRVNSLDAYEFRFASVSKGTEKGDIQLWGRVIFLPSGHAGDSTGATLILLATSLAPELSGVDDVGEKGEMPMILDSFRFARKR
jgi:flagellar basal body-associated protein FliL